MPALPTGFPFSRLARNTAWASLDNWIQQIFQLVTFLVVGSRLGPEGLGLMAMALLYTGLLNVLLMNGFTDVLIQRSTLDRAHLTSTFWAMGAAGALAAALSFVLAPAVGFFFRDPALGPIVQALSIALLFMGLSAFYDAWLRRGMQFSALAVRSLVAAGGASILAILMAQAGYGIWSLVAYQIFWRVAELGVLLAFARWIPEPRISRPHLAELMDYGLHTVATRLLAFFGNGIDRILVGAVMGAGALGIYAMAQRLVEALMQGLTGIFQGVALPMLSRLQDDPQKLARAVRGAIQLDMFIALPAFAGLAAVAEPMIATLLGPRWEPMAPVLQILAFSGALSTICFFPGAALRSIGRADLTFHLHVVTLLVMTAGLGAAILLGLPLVLVAAAHLAASVLVVPVWFCAVEIKIPLGGPAFARTLLPTIASVAIMLAALFFVRTATASYLSPLQLLIAMVLTGAAVYALATKATAPATVGLALRLLKERG